VSTLDSFLAIIGTVLGAINWGLPWFSCVLIGMWAAVAKDVGDLTAIEAAALCAELAEEAAQ
jgi:hypothetical protein